MYSVILNGLQTNTQQEDQALQQVSSGQKLNSLSDNPAAAATLVTLRMQSSSDTQYLQNISSLTGSLNVADSALSSVVEALTTRAIPGGGGSEWNPQRLRTGKPLPSKFKVSSRKFWVWRILLITASIFFPVRPRPPNPTWQTASAASGVTYNGNDNTNSVEISQGQAMPISLPGSQMFSNATTNVFQSLQDLYNALNTNGDIGQRHHGSPERVELCEHPADLLRKLRGSAQQRPNLPYPGTNAIDRN